jgi:UDP-N-acetyl-2-amino-2-deoxyglucuronate dehydrogenase
MKQHNKLKFAVVGCGRVSNNHLKALTSGQIGSELVAVCDIDEKKAQLKSEEFKVPYYLDYHEMMKRHPEIDVVDIATPTGYHAKHVIDLSRYGKHIVVEKPMALHVSDCDAMIKACADNKCRLFVVKQNRFNTAVVATREALDNGRFGKLVMGTVRVRWTRLQSYYEQDNWHGTWEMDGGVMSQQSSHHLDLLQWFLGPIEEMQCISTTRLLNIEVEDTSLATFKFKSGALGAYEATVATRPEDLEGSLSILGEKGSVIIGGQAVNKIIYWKFMDEQPEDVRMQDSSSQEVPNVYGHGHAPYLANVIDAIVNNKPALVEATEGKKNIEILTALYESAALGGKYVKPGCPIQKSRLGKKTSGK